MSDRALSLIICLAGYAAVILLENLHIALLHLCRSGHNSAHVKRTDRYSQRQMRDAHYRIVLRFYPLYTAAAFIAAGLLRAKFIGVAFDPSLILACVVWPVVCIILDIFGGFFRRHRPWHLEFGELSLLQYQRRISLAYINVMLGLIIGTLIAT